MTRLARLAIPTMILALSGACGAGSTSTLSRAPKIEISPASLTVPIEDGQIAEGDVYRYTVTVRNTGDAPLTIEGLTFTQTKCEGETGDGAFTLKKPSAMETAETVQITYTGSGDTKLPDSILLVVEYAKPAASCAREAKLTILSDDPKAERATLVVTFQVILANPHIEADDLDFGYVPEAQERVESINLTNTGLGTLKVGKITFSGSEGFYFQWPCVRSNGDKQDTWIKLAPTAQTIVVCDPEDAGCTDSICQTGLTIAGNSSMEVPVKHTPVCLEDETAACPPPSEGKLTFVSNDPDYDAASNKGLDVAVMANVGGPCIRADPSAVDFPSQLIATPGIRTVKLIGCGDEPVKVTKVALAEGSSLLYELDLTGLGAFDEATPLVIKPDESKTFVVKYLPQEQHVDGTGQLVPDTATIVVTNDTPAKELKVPVSGLAVKGECAVCEFSISTKGPNGTTIEVKDGDEVAVLSRLDFKSNSYDLTPGGGIVAYKWRTKEYPPDSKEGFYPADVFKDPQFAVNVTGNYTFELSVTNKMGCEASCSKLVRVPPPKGCHIELTWKTPLDPDETDQCGGQMECGSDVDLHVVHPYASGPDVDKDGKSDGFFDVNYDCFWFNPHPGWPTPTGKESDPDYQASLDRDDQNGGGPETFNYPIPEADKCYKIGVHYWSDHGFGAAYPTLRIWIDGVDVYTNTTQPKLKMLDMWEVGEVCCSAHTFTPYQVAGGNVIIPGYLNPDFKVNPD